MKQDIRRLAETGPTDTAIAEQCGCVQQILIDHLCDAGIRYGRQWVSRSLYASNIYLMHTLGKLGNARFFQPPQRKRIRT